jgi:parvulin-like peptidyl-prolyl isomerase
LGDILPLAVPGRPAYHRAAVKRFFTTCGWVAAMFLFQGRPAHADLITGLAVVVNDSVVTRGEILDRFKRARPTVDMRFRTDPSAHQQALSKLQDEVVEGFIQDKLILHAYFTSGYQTNVVEAFIDDEIQRRIKDEYYGDRTRLIQSLHAMGQTYEMYRREQREKIIIEIMNQQNISNPHKILISPLKIEQYYQAHKDEFKMDDLVRVRMIILTNAPYGAPDSARKLGEEILRKIDAGVPFAEMAAVYSAGPYRAEGGDRGWRSREDFLPGLRDIAFNLKPGQHSGVIELPEACYLMMIEEVKASHVKEMKEVRDDIERTLRNKENIRLRQLWIDRLKRKSYINYY